MNRDTFLTVRYRNGYIHSCYDRDQRREIVTYQLPDHRVQAAGSILGAKRAITRAQVTR
jgi:hypothetical protein